MSDEVCDSDAPPEVGVDAEAEPGLGASPAVGSVAAGVVARVKEHHVPLNAAGVAFFGFLSTVPALVALVSVYGLVADPDAIEARVDDFGEALPDEARQLIVQQLESITATAGGALTIGLLVSLAIALWSASSGMSHLVVAVNQAYGRSDTRKFLAKRLLSLALTLGAIVFAAVAVAAITALPAILSAVGLTGVVRWLLNLAVWPVVGLGLAMGLAVLYRAGPEGAAATRWRWVSPGALIAVAAWVVASVGFQVYAANFGSYNETYGSLGAVVVLLLWIWISALVVLIGAEINAEIEQATA